MTTLAQLKTSIDAWLIRDDVAVTGSDFPQILLNTESEISRAYRFMVQEKTDTVSFGAGERKADLPADFLEIRNPFIDDNIRRFEYQTPQAIRESAQWDGSRTPTFYTIEGGGGTSPDDRVQLVLAPAASDNGLDVEINYWARFPALVNDTDTNWLLQNHYDIYLFESLFQSAIYIQETELAERYRAMCEDLRLRTGRNENRKRFAAVPKQSYANPRGVV